MRILVYPCLMEIGGSQLNAVELAKGVSDAGHDVVLFGPDGQLLPLVRELGLEYIFTPVEHRWPSVRAMRALTTLARQRSLDVVHGYEWGPSVDLLLGPHLRTAVPLVTTVMSMDVPDLIPTHAPLVVGTSQLAQEQHKLRPTYLMEPWIDLRLNHPGASGGREGRAAFGFGVDDIVISVVCRLTTDLEKLQGVIVAMEAASLLATVGAGGTPHWKLLVVGGGPGLEAAQSRAKTINDHLQQEVVVVTGGLLDPRAAYDCADVVIGMGSSALKGLAFGKPLVVQGAGGYWRHFDAESADVFLSQGFYGEGADPDGRTGLDSLVASLMHFAASASAREASGRLGRQLIERRFSLDAAVETQLTIYEAARTHRYASATIRRSAARTVKELVKFKAHQALFRARPLRESAGSGTTTQPQPLSGRSVPLRARSENGVVAKTS